MPGVIGFGMLDPVLNEPRNLWYQKRNHVRIPKIAESKKYLDAYYTGGGDTFPADIIFDNEGALALVEPSEYLPPASVTFVDESGDGGKKFMRVVASATGTAAHAVLRFVDQFPQEGIYRMLARISGTAPANNQTRGPCILGRFTIPDPSGPDSGYALGHVRYDETDRQRIRRLIEGTATILVGLDTNPPFAHGDWFWAVFKMDGTGLSGYYYLDSDPDPGTFTLITSDATYEPTHGNSALSFQGSNALNSDIAEFHYEPITVPLPHAEIVLAEAHDGNTDTWDLQDVPLGAPAADRIVAVGISTTNANVTSLTIDGIQATRVVESEPFTNRTITSWWVAEVPEGEDVEILWWQNNVTSWAVAVVVVGHGLTASPLDIAEDHDDGYPNTGIAALDLSLRTAEHGFVAALAAASVTGSPSTNEWSGLDDHDTITHVGQATWGVPATLTPSASEAERAVAFEIGGNGAETYALGAAAVSFAPIATPSPEIQLVQGSGAGNNVALNITNAIGDYIVLCDVRASFNATGGLVDGFDVLATVMNTATPGCGCKIFGRFAESENETIPVNSGNISNRFYAVYRGIDPDDPIRDIFATESGTPSTTVLLPAIPAGNSGRVVSGFWVRQGSDGNAGVDVPNPPLTALTRFANVTGRGVLGDTGGILTPGMTQQSIAVTSALWIAWSLILNPERHL